jgi:hypothetical protein
MDNNQSYRAQIYSDELQKALDVRGLDLSDLEAYGRADFDLVKANKIIQAKIDAARATGFMDRPQTTEAELNRRGVFTSERGILCIN